MYEPGLYQFALQRILIATVRSSEIGSEIGDRGLT